jgi:hypothetical protein
MGQNCTCPTPHVRVLLVHIREYALLAAFIDKSESYWQHQWKISGATGVVQLRLIIGMFRQQLPDGPHRCLPYALMLRADFAYCVSSYS